MVCEITAEYQGSNAIDKRAVSLSLITGFFVPVNFDIKIG